MTDMLKQGLFSCGEAAAILGASCKGNLDSIITAVQVDSRAVVPGSAFFALMGERVDGHDFIGKALNAGAVCIIAAENQKAKAFDAMQQCCPGWPHIPASVKDSRANPPVVPCLIVVPSVLNALQKLAREYRARMKSLVRIGVTGSSGKTTTKECIGAILAANFGTEAVAMNKGNLNSDIGLALSMFTLKPEHRVAVFEMGMNRQGEIEELAWILEPDYAVITNIGTAHIGILGSRQAIAEEKKKVFSRFTGKQVGFIWEDDDFRDFLREGVNGRVRSFGFSSFGNEVSIAPQGLSGWEIRWKNQIIQFPLLGKHNCLDALAALAVADELELDPAATARGLSTVQPLFGRSQIFQGSIDLLFDCYNANPDSMSQAIEFCDSVPARGRKVLVLGSMLELGEMEEEEHRLLGEKAYYSSAEAVFFFGPETKASLGRFSELMEGTSAVATKAGNATRTVFHTDSMDELAGAVLSFLKPGDLVLLKASRGRALERLADHLQSAGLVKLDSEKEDRHAS